MNDTKALGAKTQEQIISALKDAYAKHVLDDDRIGWGELADTLCDALCEAIGDREFVKWKKKVTE